MIVWEKLATDFGALEIVFQLRQIGLAIVRFGCHSF